MNLLTHKYWNKICSTILCSTEIVSVDKYLSKNSDIPRVIIKHDVEYDIDMAVAIGEIESKKGISSTFYFQFDVAISSPDKVMYLKSLGHDIGYHYDVLDENNGDFDKALSQFRDHLESFSKIGIEIKSVCPHGNPIKTRFGWSSNKDFFRNNDIRAKFPNIVDIVVDRKTIFPENFLYVSDAGYSFKVIGDVSNNDRIKVEDKLISLPYDLPLGEKTILISTHPHRWFNSVVRSTLKRSIFLIARRLGKSLNRIKILKPFFNSLYHMARRF